MKLLIIGDLHGRKPIIKVRDFDAIVLVGDICDDKKIGPLYKEWFKELKLNPKASFEEVAFEKVDKREYRKMEKESLLVGRKILKYLDKFGKPIFMVAGNWDQSFGKTRIKNPDKNYYNQLKYFLDSHLGSRINLQLTKGIKNIKNCMFNCIEFKEVNFIGYGLSRGPERIRKNKEKEIGEAKFDKLKKSYKKVGDKLSNSYKKRKNKNLPTFFITHNIPYGTKLDIGKDKKSYAYKKHLGSTIARDFCRKFRPEICVGGHVHEGKGKDKIGKTVVVNPGYGKDAQVLIEINEEKRKIKRVKFIE